MIILRSEKGEIYNLFLKKKHVVGRNGNLELEGDKSVSRQHAVIYFSIKDKKPHILLEDLGSKYGTYINDGIQTSKEISKNTPITLKVGDSIRFGQQWNTWTVQESQIVVTTSMLSEQEKRKLRSILAPMKGVLVSDWSESCTHLTMNGVKITIKVVCALGSVKPIVSMEYWQVLSEVWNSSVEEDMPDCDDYVPPLTEPTLSNVPINLKMSYARKRLFRDVKFVACTSSQYNSILPMVTNAGGTVLDGTRTAITEQEFLDEKILVLDATNINKRNQNLAQLLKLLTKHKQRRIPESEIGLSLIFCSMDKYCNPHSQEEFISRQPESQVTIKDEDLILAQETQDLGEENSTQFFDSESSKISLTVNENRIFSDSDEDDVVLETQPSRMLLASPKPATKRKLDHKTDKPNVKTSKLDSWLITKKPVATSTMISEPSAQPHSSSESTKTKTKSLFAFPSEKKTTERSSNSLFKNVNVASTSDRSDVGENTRKRTSIELFSSYESPSVPVKKAIVEKKSLFQLPSTSNESKPKRSLILFDSDSMDSFSDKTANLNIAPQPKVAEDSPVVVPRNISLSQFVEPQANKSNGEVKQEPCDMSTEVKEVFDKTIIHTLSLIKSNSKTITQTPNGGNTSTVVNFKKFRKNGIHHKTHVIKTNDLVLFKGKASADPDVHMNGDSDSS